MSSSISKRQLARNERALHDLLSSVPGNDQCADCQARNPGWASWSLGVFLCMRCASLHRKLGTHVSKVKSLSMDTWTSEQVDNMKRNGNTVVNKIYNPKNVKPGIPLDVDEVDSAMERFIKQKYQDRSLLNGKPRPPPRTEPSYTRSPQGSPQGSPPPPPLPPKKGKLFGFGLRAHSSVYPLSKHDQKNFPLEPTLENAFRAESQGDKPSKQWRRSAGVIEDADLRAKLATLREMGFPDDRRNTTVLRGLGGDLERTIESLVRLGERSKSTSRNTTPIGSNKNTPSTANFPDDAKRTSSKAPSISSNPFDQVSTNHAVGLSFDPSSQQQEAPRFDAESAKRPAAMPSYNPFDATQDIQSTAGNLEQSFHGMHISQNLFPNWTGGHRSQTQPFLESNFQQSATPPVPAIPAQYSQYVPSTVMNGNNNPFLPHLQHTGNNPYTPMMHNNNTQVAPASNLFFSQPSLPTRTIQSPPPMEPSQAPQNPFDNAPSNPQQTVSQQQLPQYDFPFNNNYQHLFSNNTTTQPFLNQNQSRIESQSQQQTTFHSFLYQQPYSMQSQPGFQSQQQSPPQPFDPQYRNQAQSQQQHYSPQLIQPQRTGRIDKSSILALYNYPHLAPQPPPMISSGTETSPVQSPLARAPANDLFGGVTISPAKRSATMPVSSSTSRNPFLNSVGVGASMPSGQAGGGGTAPKHASHESMNVSNLESGRHSPDAFASLSARYVQ